MIIENCYTGVDKIEAIERVLAQNYKGHIDVHLVHNTTPKGDSPVLSFAIVGIILGFAAPLVLQWMEPRL